MTERRYSDDEVAAIFERATAHVSRTGNVPARRDGPTLAELQAIGREAGIAPEAIAAAARAVERTAPAVRGRFAGFPLKVGHTVDLDGVMSDAEWEQLVADARVTFDARGRIGQSGAFREWTNGNLQVLVEPTATGHRVRLRTLKGNSRAYMTVGLAMAGMAGAVLVTALVAGSIADPGTQRVLALLSAMGVGFFGVGAAQLPGWARRRAEQMEAIVDRLLERRDRPA